VYLNLFLSIISLVKYILHDLQDYSDASALNHLDAIQVVVRRAHMLTMRNTCHGKHTTYIFAYQAIRQYCG